MKNKTAAVAVRWFPTFCLRKTIKRNVRANEFVDRLLHLIVAAGAHAHNSFSFFFSRNYRAKLKQRSVTVIHVIYLLAFLLIALLSQVLRDDKIVFDNDGMCRCRSRYLLVPSCNSQLICVTRMSQVCTYFYYTLLNKF